MQFPPKLPGYTRNRNKRISCKPEARSKCSTNKVERYKHTNAELHKILVRYAPGRPDPVKRGIIKL